MSPKLLLIVAGLLCSSAQAEPATKATKPVEAPPKVEMGESPRPEVTITEGRDRTITEYRIHGVVRAIKVQAKGLPAYYLVDKEGSGSFVRIGADTGPEAALPKWVLMEW